MILYLILSFIVSAIVTIRFAEKQQRQGTPLTILGWISSYIAFFVLWPVYVFHVIIDSIFE